MLYFSHFRFCFSFAPSFSLSTLPLCARAVLPSHCCCLGVVLCTNFYYARHTPFLFRCNVPSIFCVLWVFLFISFASANRHYSFAHKTPSTARAHTPYTLNAGCSGRYIEISLVSWQIKCFSCIFWQPFVNNSRVVTPIFPLVLNVVNVALFDCVPFSSDYKTTHWMHVNKNAPIALATACGMSFYLWFYCFANVWYSIVYRVFSSNNLVARPFDMFGKLEEREARQIAIFYPR